MITTTDWNDTLDAWVEEERERLDGPPSPDEVVAYLGGELSPRENARVRALLVYYPELTHLLDEKIEKPRRVPWMQLYAAAATIAVAVLLFDRGDEPRIITSPYELSSHGTRGVAAPHELPGGEEEYAITIVSPMKLDGVHEIEIVRGSKVVWSKTRRINSAFGVTIPGEILSPGTYALRIRKGERLIDSYAFRVTEPRSPNAGSPR